MHIWIIKEKGKKNKNKNKCISHKKIINKYIIKGNEKFVWSKNPTFQICKY
jgi:hypothetical protein